MTDDLLGAFVGAVTGLAVIGLAIAICEWNVRRKLRAKFRRIAEEENP